MRRLVAKSAVAVMAAVVVVLILQTPAVLGQPERPRDGQGKPGQWPQSPPERPGREPPGGGPWNNDVLVYRVRVNGEVIQIATYKVASGAKPGFFVTGQEADLMLGGFGFNNAAL